MKNVDEESLKKIPTNKIDDDPLEFADQPAITGNKFWSTIKWLHERGLHKGDYQEYEKPFYNINKGAHYFVVEDPKKRSIRCISCPVKHGGILESHLLTRYLIKNGTLFLDDRPINQTPSDFTPPD